MQLDVIRDDAPTEVGSYFISNYPPFSVWSPEHVASAEQALRRPPAAGVSAAVGLYLHIPFCRKRCKFCYFRVYTDKNGREVDDYCDALAREIALYADMPGLQDRAFEFVYFGGGTPSFLSSRQLERLIARISEHWNWDRAREVTFECEPGTLKKGKLETIKSIGVTRLSLGIEHFDDDVLEINGRAHKSPEVFQAYEWARSIGFDQINIDLIAGMVGDDDAKWRDTVDKAVALAPDCVTIYQMEVPHNTVIAREAGHAGEHIRVVDWSTKRRWVQEAFERFGAAGYVVSSAYTLVQPGERSRFVYRDAVWHGADMVGTGVASFSHFGGVHYQNCDGWADYIGAIDAGRLPLARAYALPARERLVRELVLQTKTGRIEAGYFRDKFGVDIRDLYADVCARLAEAGFLTVDGDTIQLTTAGLLRVDALLPNFFDDKYRDIRYT